MFNINHISLKPFIKNMILDFYDYPTCLTLFHFCFQMHHPIQMKPADSEKSNGMCFIYFYLIVTLSKLKQTQHCERFCFTPCVVKTIRGSFPTPDVVGKMLTCSELPFILSFKGGRKCSEKRSSLYLLYVTVYLTTYIFPLCSPSSEVMQEHLLLIRWR